MQPSKYAVCRKNPWWRTLCQNCNMFLFFWGGDHFDSCCGTNRKVAGSIPASVSGFFIDIKSFRSHYGPGVDSASNRSEYQEYFLGLKEAGA